MSDATRSLENATAEELSEEDENKDGRETAEEMEEIQQVENAEHTDHVEDVKKIENTKEVEEKEEAAPFILNEPEGEERERTRERESVEITLEKEKELDGENSPATPPDKLDAGETRGEEPRSDGEEIVPSQEGSEDYVLEDHVLEYLTSPEWKMDMDKEAIEDVEIIRDPETATDQNSNRIDDSSDSRETISEVEEDADSPPSELPYDRVLFNYLYAHNIPWETEDPEDESEGEEDPDVDAPESPEISEISEISENSEHCDPVLEVTETTPDPTDAYSTALVTPQESPSKNSHLLIENQETSVMTAAEQLQADSDTGTGTGSPPDQIRVSDIKPVDVLDRDPSERLPALPSLETLHNLTHHLDFDENALLVMENFFNSILYSNSVFRWKEETIASHPLPKFLAHCQAIRDETYKLDMIKVKKGYIFSSFLGCSSLQVKYLTRGAVKAKLWPKLDRSGYYTHFSADSKPLSQGGKIPDVLLSLPKSAKELHAIWEMNEPLPENVDAYDQWLSSKPGHQAVERYIYQQIPEVLAMETPVWDERLQITGHIDLLIQDGKTLYVVDYKPEVDRENEYRFIKSLPQVSMYGKLMQQFIPKDIQVKCVSFSKDHAWVYDPQLMQNTLVAAIQPFVINSDALNDNVWIPLSQDQPIPLATLSQGRVNKNFRQIAEGTSSSNYLRNYRRILYRLQAGKDLVEKDFEFIRKGVQKKFNISDTYLGGKLDEFLLEYQKKFQEPELRDKFYADIIDGKLLSKSVDNYLSSKFAVLSRERLMRSFGEFRGFTRNILLGKSSNPDSLDPYLKENFERAMKTDKRVLQDLEAKWIETMPWKNTKPVGEYPSIYNFVADQMAQGKNLTAIKQELLTHFPKKDHEVRTAYFCKIVSQTIHKDRERALKSYQVPLTWKLLNISALPGENVKIEKAISPYHLEKQLDGVSSLEFYKLQLEQNRTFDQIIESVFTLIPPEEQEQRFNSFLHSFRDWVKSHREYLVEHYRIPQDAPYQIKELDNFKVSVELRLTRFCQQRLAQGIPIENFTQEGLNQCPPDRQHIKWRQICNIINQYAQKNPQKFEKSYGIPANYGFSAAKYLTDKVTLSFKKQSRKFKPAFKYNFEHGSLKDQVLMSLSHNPSMELQPFFQSLVGRYPSKQKEIRTAFRRHVNSWIKTHPDHPQQELLKQKLHRMYIELQASTIRALSNKELLAKHRRESTIEQFMQKNQDHPLLKNFKKNSLFIDLELDSIAPQFQLCIDLLANRPVEPSMEQFMNTFREKRGKSAQLHTVITYISRLRNLIEYKVNNPECTLDDLWNQPGMGNQALSYFIKNVIKDVPLENLESLSQIKPEPTPRGLFFIELLQNSPLKRCTKRYQTCALESSDQKLLRVNLNEDVKQFRNLIQFRLSNPKYRLETMKGHFIDTLPNFVQERVFQMGTDMLSEFHVNRISAIATHDSSLIDRYLHEKYFTPKISAESTAEVHQKIHQFYDFLHTRFPTLDSIQSITIRHFDAYVAHIAKEKHISGFSLENYHAHIHRFLAHFLPEFGKYSATTGIAKTTQISIDQTFLDRFLQDQYITPGKSKDSLTTAKRAITDYYCFLRHDFPDIHSVTAMDNYRLADFSIFLISHKQLSEGTVKNKIGFVKRYLAHLS